MAAARSRGESPDASGIVFSLIDKSEIAEFLPFSSEGSGNSAVQRLIPMLEYLVARHARLKDFKYGALI